MLVKCSLHIQGHRQFYKLLYLKSLYSNLNNIDKVTDYNFDY